jgi:hypothetical protein
VDFQGDFRERIFSLQSVAQTQKVSHQSHNVNDFVIASPQIVARMQVL